MEEDDVDFDGKPGQSIPVQDCKALGMSEDSVDIYEDLASSPVPFEHGEGGVAFDLLEELLIEETSLKVRTHEELCQKFEESQQQIEVFTKNMKTVQEQNTLLLSQNEQLKKNICALFKTAKAEINRKDDEIRRLHSSLTSLKCSGSWRRHAAQHERTQHHERSHQHESRSTRTSPPATVVASSSSRHNGQRRRGSPAPEEAVEPDSSQTERVDPTARHRVSASDKTSALDSSAKTPSDQPKRPSVYQSESRLDQSHRPRFDRTLSRSERSVSSHLERSKSRLDQSDRTHLEHSDTSRAAWSDKPHSNRIKPCLGQSDKADVRQSKSHLDRSDTSRVVDQSKSHSDKSDKSRVDHTKSRVDQADTSRVDQAKSRVDQSMSRVDRSDTSRVVDQSKSHSEKSKSRVHQADKSCVDQAKSHVDQAKSRVDQSMSRVDQQSMSRVDQSDTSRVVDQSKSHSDKSKSRVHQADKSCVDQAKSHVDQAKSCVDQSMSRVDQQSMSRVDQSDTSRVVDQSKSHSDKSKSRVHQADKSCVDQAKSRVDHADTSRVDQAKSHVDQAKSRVDQSMSRVDQQSMSRVDQPMSRVDPSMSRVDQTDASRVDQAESRVDQADTSRVDQTKSRVDQTKSRVDQAKSRVDQTMSRIDQADTSRVDQADTSHVDQAMSRVDQSESRVDQSMSRVDQAKSPVDQADTSRVDQADASRIDQAMSRVDRADASPVDQAMSLVDQSKSRVDHADKSPVDQAELRVDQADTSPVDQADASCVDKSKSCVDQSMSRVDQDRSRVNQADESRVNQSMSLVDQTMSRVDQADTSRVDQAKSHVDQCDEVCVDRSKSQLSQSSNSPSDHLDVSCPTRCDTPHAEQHNARLEQSESSLVHSNRSHIDHSKTQSVQPEQLHIDQSNKTTSDNSGKPSLDESMSRSEQSPKSHFNQSSILNPKQSDKPHTHLSEPRTDDASKAHLHQSERPHSDRTEKSCSHHPKPHMDEAAKAVESISERPILPNSSKCPPLSVSLHDPEQHFESLASARNQDAPIATSLGTPQAPPGGHQLSISQPELPHRVELRGRGGGTPRPGEASQAQTGATEGSTKKTSEIKAAPMHGATADPTETTVDLRLLLQALSLDRCEGDDEKQSVPSCPSEVGTGEQGHEKRSVSRSGESGGRGDCDQVTSRRHSFKLAVTAHDRRAKEHERSRNSVAEEAHKGRVRQLKSKSGFPDATTGQTDRNIMDYPKHSLHGTDLDVMPSEECSATRSKASTSSTIYNQERHRQRIESSGSQCWSLDGADGKEREQRSEQDTQSHERNDGGKSRACDGTREGLLGNNRKEKTRGERSHRVDKCQRPRDSHRNADASQQRCHGTKGSKRRVGERKRRPADDFGGCSPVCAVRYRRDGSAEKHNARHKASKVDKRGSVEGREGKGSVCGRGNLHENREGESSLPREANSSASRKKISAEKERSKEKLKRSGGSAVRTPGEMQEHSHSECAESSPKHESRGRKFNSARNVVGINDPCDGALPDDLRQRWGFGAEQPSFSALSEFAQRGGGTFGWCLAPEGVTEPPTSPPAIVVEQSSSVAEASELNNSDFHQPDNMDDLVVVDEFILENSGDSNSEADRDGDGPEESVEIWHAHSSPTVDQHAGSAEHSEILAKRDSEGTSALVHGEFSEGNSGDVALAAGRPSRPTEHHSQQDDVVITLERNVSAATSRDSEASPERTEAAQTPRKGGGNAEEVPELKQSKVTFMSSLSLALSPQRGIRANNVDSGSAGVEVAAVVAAVAEVATAPSSQMGPPATMGKQAEDSGSRDKDGTDPAAAGPLEDVTKSILSGHLREEFPCAAAMPQQNSGSVKESTPDSPPDAEDDGPEEGEIVSDTEPEDIPRDTRAQDTKGSSSRANCTTTTSPANTTTTAVITATVASVADRAALPVRRNREPANRCRSASANPRGNKKWSGKLSWPNGYASQKHGRFPNKSCRQEFNLRKRSHLGKNAPTGPAKQNDRSEVSRPGNKNRQPEQALLTMQSILNELESVRKLVHSTYPISSTHARDPPLFEILDYAEKQSVDTLNKFNWRGQDGSKMELRSLIRKSIGQLKNNTNFESLFSGQRPHETGVLLRLLDTEFDILFNNIRYTLCLQQLGSRPHNASRATTHRRSVKSMSAEQCGTVSGRDECKRLTSPKHAVGGKASVATASPARSPLATTGVNANLKVYKVPKCPNGVLRSPVERRDPVCMPHFKEGMAPVQSSTLRSPNLGVMSVREPQSQLKRKMCSEVEVISAPVKKATPVGKRRKIEPEGNFNQTVKGFKSVAGDRDNCGSAAEKKTEAVSSGGKSGSRGSSGSGNGGSGNGGSDGHGDFALEGVAEDVEMTSVELDECPVTPGKSMFGPDVDKATEPPDSAEASRVSESQPDDKSPAAETPQEPPPLPPSLHFTLCTESNMGDQLMSLLGVNRPILTELSVAKSPEVQVTYPCLECSESLPSSDGADTSCEKSKQLKSPDSTFFTYHESTNWVPPISSILLADLEVSNSLLSPLKDSYSLTSCAMVGEKMPLPSDGLKFVSLPAACYSENAQFDEEESDFHLALDTESPSEDGDSGQKFSPLKNRAPKEGFFEIVTHEAPQSQKSGEADTDFGLHSECEGVSRKWQVPFEEECDGGKPVEVAEVAEEEEEEEEAEETEKTEKAKEAEAAEEAEEEEEKLSKTPELHGCKRRRHSKSPVTAKQDGNKKKRKKASETNLVSSPESGKHSVGPESPTSGRKKKSSMPPSAEELLTPAKGHRRKRKKSKSRRSSGNVVELGEDATSSPGEKPPRKGRKRSGCDTSPDKVILAKNVVKKHGEVVLLWTRDDDRLILSEVQRHGASPDIFSSVAALLGDKTGSQVSRRFRELLKLFQKAAAAERLANDSDTVQESDLGSSPPPAAHAPRC